MNITAINSMSTPNFNGLTKKKKAHKQENNNAQMDAPASKSASRGMKTLLPLAVLGMTTTAGLTSCEPFIKTSADTQSWAKAWSLSNPHVIRDTTVINNTDTIHTTDTIHHTDTIIETIIKPVEIRKYPVNIGDSLVAQGENIGIEVVGPHSYDQDNVVFLASKAFNEYDRKFYETQVDPGQDRTNDYQLGLTSKITDLYYGDDKPQTSWMKSNVVDVPGRGIRIDRWVCDREQKPTEKEQYLWNYAGYEIRTNGRDWARNNVEVFDRSGKSIYKSEYLKGMNPGTFMYGVISYDENGDPIYNEDGTPAIQDYNFTKGKIWSGVVEPVEYVDIIE